MMIIIIIIIIITIIKIIKIIIIHEIKYLNLMINREICLHNML